TRPDAGLGRVVFDLLGRYDPDHPPNATSASAGRCREPSGTKSGSARRTYPLAAPEVAVQAEVAPLDPELAEDQDAEDGAGNGAEEAAEFVGVPQGVKTDGDAGRGPELLGPHRPAPVATVGPERRREDARPQPVRERRTDASQADHLQDGGQTAPR